jgi:tetratricopeptide (TPR) repeat protein
VGFREAISKQPARPAEEGTYMQRAFIIRPFGNKKDRAGREIDFEQVSTDLLAPALYAAGLGGGTTGEIFEAGNIREDMFGLIVEADIVVCDITIHNANVFYELGIRHALRKKRTVIIRGTLADEVPFDTLTDRYLAYDIDKPGAALQQLTDTLIATLASEKTDSPIFKMLPTLIEVDPVSIVFLPKDLAEEVERAKSARAVGWLRLLSQEVETRRFQWLALRMIGQAQWDIGDSDGALRTYQKLTGQDPDDLEANNALANLYERQYRREKHAELLAASDRAIKRVLANGRATQEQRTEALSLAGRNAKTQWRQAFEDLTSVAERRTAAINRQLIEAYDSYRRAYYGNLNHYWSGLAALQMCAIAKSLADEESWEDAFESEREATDNKEALGLAFDELKVAVKLTVQQARTNLTVGSDERIWADICNADLLFLTEEKESRVRRGYRDSIPPLPWFVGATTAQLDLFVKLGIRAGLAETIIADLVASVAAPPDTSRPSSIVIVAGHQIDEPERAQVRFPESAEAAVRDSLRERLARLNQGPGGIRVLASGASGTDIICHELCRELSVKSTICLPMPVDSYSTETFKGNLDGWRSRFLALVGSGIDSLQLSNTPGLPRWLQGTTTDEWERGNRWVLQLALSAGAPKVSLIAVWDGGPTRDGKGGTAHMVQIARAAGTVDVDVIKLKEGAIQS